MFLILSSIIIPAAFLMFLFRPDEANSPPPTVTPTPLPISTPEPRANPTITIDMDRNGQHGLERPLTIRFGNLTPQSGQFAYLVSVSDHRCNGQGMAEFTHIDTSDASQAITSMSIATTCISGAHDLTVTLYRDATIVAERTIIFAVTSPPLTPSPTPAPTNTPCPDTYVNSYSHLYSNLDTDSDRYSYFHADSYSATRRYLHVDTNSHIHSPAYCNSSNRSNTHSNSNTNTVCHTNSYCNTYSNRYSQTNQVHRPE